MMFDEDTIGGRLSKDSELISYGISGGYLTEDLAKEFLDSIDQVTSRAIEQGKEEELSESMILRDCGSRELESIFLNKPDYVAATNRLIWGNTWNAGSGIDGIGGSCYRSAIRSLGHFVIKAAEEKDIPVVPVTKLSHGSGTLVLLMHNGYTSVSEIDQYTGENRVYRGLDKKVKVTSETYERFKRNKQRKGVELDNDWEETASVASVERIVYNKLPLCLSKAIALIDSDKGLFHYALALEPLFSLLWWTLFDV